MTKKETQYATSESYFYHMYLPPRQTPDFGFHPRAKSQIKIFGWIIHQTEQFMITKNQEYIEDAKVHAQSREVNRIRAAYFDIFQMQY